ncbi:hypothetical protein I4U23_025789 [Adineta vaga]|nr:hypothetical protein I4U23_025789 [Adineta vaga]
MTTQALLKKLKPEEIAEIETAFKEFDKDDNGSITAEEMHECLRRSHVSHDNSEVSQVIKHMDINRDGNVSYDEYLNYMAHIYTGQPFIPAPESKKKAKK